MLSAINQKIDIVVGGINNIQKSIIELNIEVRKIPEATKKIVLEHYNLELTDGLAGLLKSYSEVRAAAETNSDILDDIKIVERLKFISNETNKTRATLSVSPVAMTPETLFAIPTTLFLEIATLSHLQFPTSYIIQVLSSYREWITRCISGEIGSIPSQRAAAIEIHQKTIDNYSSSRVGQLLGIANYPFSETDTDRKSRATDLCFGFSHSVADQITDTYDKLIESLTFAANFLGGTLLERSSHFGIKFEQSLNAFQYSYDRGILSMTVARNKSLEGFGPFKQTTICTWKKAGFTDDIDKAVAYAETIAEYQDLEKQSQQLSADVDLLNLLRARIEICKKSAQIAYDTLAQVETQLIALGAN